MTSAPIIFIHFSNSSFLKYTLEAAKLFNPDKRVILLGDETNDRYAHLGIEHFNFVDYNYSDRLKRFNDVYQFIAGKKQKYSFKQRFFFERWFLMFNFVVAQNIRRFWTFDSDTLIITSLKEQEPKFAEFDCTEQCNGSCMNGFINNVEVVAKYLDKINELFVREEYLEKQRKFLEIYSHRRFTEMDAYWTYKHESTFKSVQLNRVIAGEFFDDCALNAHTFEVYPIEVKGRRTLKKFYLGSSGNIYANHLLTGQLEKFNTINLSWLPDIFFWTLFKQAKKKLVISPNSQYVKETSVTPLDIRPLMLFYQFFERPVKWTLRKLNVAL